MRKILGMALAVLLSAGAAGAQDFDAGVAAYHRGDYAAALKEWRPLAEAGLVEAQVNLGIMYRLGEGVPQDKAEAARWDRLAAGQGDAQAQFNLAVQYDNGDGVPQDKTEAARWYRLAADQGYANAQLNVGFMYDFGEGVSQDKAEAVRWYRLAADQGNAKAQTNLGAMYFVGEGVLQNNIQAHMRGNIGCALGDEGGCKIRDMAEAKMTPADISEAQRRARVCMESDYKDCD